MRGISALDLQSRYVFIKSLLQLSVVDGVEGAFPKTILNFLKNMWSQLASKKTSEIFAVSHEALWVSPFTILKLDPETGVFGKRIRSQNGQSELLLAFIKNVIAQFGFSPFFPESVKGEFQLIPFKIRDKLKTSSVSYGIFDSFNLDIEGDSPVEFLVYLGDGRSLRDLRRMTEINVDIRALRDMFGYLASESSNIFPLIPYQKVEKHKDHYSLIIKKMILRDNYTLKLTLKCLQDTSLNDLEIRRDENPHVFSYFVLEEVKNHLNKGDKGWDLLQQITQKNPEWFKKKQLRYRRFAKNGKETEVIPMPKGYKLGFIPSLYRNKYQAYYNKDIEILEVLVPAYRIIFSKPSTFFKISIEFTINTIKHRYHLKPITLKNIFTKETLDYIHFLQDAKSREDLSKGKIMSLLDMLEVSYRSLSFLVLDNTVIAGAFSYLTYFGRDTAFSYLFLKPFLHDFTQQKMVQQLLNRANKNGEAAHEIDSRIIRGEEDHYDYRMRDTDFLMAISTLELLKAMNSNELSIFLNHQEPNNRYNIITQDTNDFIHNSTVIFRNLNNILSIIENNDFIPLKNVNDPSSANWRDAINSFCRGTYPYDVNAIWVPHFLHLLKSFKNDVFSEKILLDFLAKTKKSLPNENFDRIESFFRSDKEEIERKIENWVQRMKKAFTISYSLEEWRTRLKNFFYDPENQTDAVRDLKKMKVGYYLREHELGKVWFTAEEMLDDKKWEEGLRFQLQYLGERFFLPNGNPFPQTICTYAMTLDKNKKPIPVIHSDIGFEAFVKSLRGEQIGKDLILPTQLPIAIGGLAIIDKDGKCLGFSVANPMLADKSGYELLLTPREKKLGTDPLTLSPWVLLEKNEYHGWGAIWEVMIDFMVAALQDTDLKNYDYLNRHYWWLLENYTRFSIIRNREVLGFKYDSNYEDWFLTEATVEKIEINDLQVFNAAGRLRVLLKSLIPGITNYWIFKREDTLNKTETSKSNTIVKT
ncbi:MAG: hypothetical protein E3K32_10200 [wastewater metagenome]|nr:hypothetical protein [Candidatus Loosdrechtia aerotolerans]